jgi:hypothetical protein
MSSESKKQKYSKSDSRNYKFMFEEVIDYLEGKGVPKGSVVGQICYDKYPLFVPDKSKGSEDLKREWEKESQLNNRVEIKLLSRN